MAAINLYKPWWIPTSNPFDIEDEEPIIPEGMMGLDEIGSLIEKKMPSLWEKAGEFDVSRFEKISDPVTGETTVQFPYRWNDKQKEIFQNPSERAAYLLDAYKPLAPLKEKSALHNLNIDFHEKWRYSVEEPIKEGLAIGAPAFLGSASRIIIETLDDFTDRSTKAYERDFGEKEDVPKEDEMVEVDGEMVPKMWTEPADEQIIGPLFESPEQQELYKEEYKKHIDAINKEKDKKVPDKERIRAIDKFNSWAEEIAIRNMEKLEKRQKKDLRYQAFQTYASEKPADWLTAFQSPEYFTDAVLSMVPSVAIMGASAGVAPIAGSAAAVGLMTVGHFPLEATGTYTEAYNWTKENTGDEELARSNASWATAEHLAFVAATESWGAMRLLGRVIPKPIRKNITNGPFKKLYKNNIATPERITELKRLKETIPGKGIGYMYRALRDPAAEALQEYVQYSGQVLAEAGYKGESRDFLKILSGDHPLVSQKEMRESVVGGAIFGGGVGFSSYVGNKMQWNKWSNKANTILNDEYGVNTGVSNLDLTEESLLDIPSVMGDVNPTPENYFKELLNSQNDEKVIVSRKKDSKKPFNKLLNKHKNYSPGALTEKLAETILEAGQDGWDNVHPSVQSQVNQMILGSVSNVNEDILNIVSDKDNIAQDILDKKISIDYITNKEGMFKIENRKIKIKDKGYVDKILNLYESQLTENLGKDATSVAKKNYLSSNFNINIEKQIDKSIKKSIQKKIGRNVDVSIEKQAEKQAEKQIQKQIEQQAINQLKKTKGIQEMPKKGEPKEDVIGQKALVIEGKFKNKGGEIISYSPKQKLVKMKLDDGTKTPPIKVSQVALTKPPAKDTSPKTAQRGIDIDLDKIDQQLQTPTNPTQEISQKLSSVAKLSEDSRILFDDLERIEGNTINKKDYEFDTTTKLKSDDGKMMLPNEVSSALKELVDLGLAVDNGDGTMSLSKDISDTGSYTVTEYSDIRSIDKLDKVSPNKLGFPGVGEYTMREYNILKYLDKNNLLPEGVTKLTLKSSNEKNAINNQKALAYVREQLATQEFPASTTTSVKKIISGGQTGADQFGLEVGQELGIETGGTAPPGFKTTKGSQKEKLKGFGLVEGESDSKIYPKRTKKNVQDSDGTVLFGNPKSKGSSLTIKTASKQNKPIIVNPTVDELSSWLSENNIETLNVAGNRKVSPEMKETLKSALSPISTEQVQKPVSKVLKPTPSTVKKPVDDKIKLENKYSSLLARRKIIVKNQGDTAPIDREIARVKKQIGDDRKVEDVFVEDKPKINLESKKTPTTTDFKGSSLNANDILELSYRLEKSGVTSKSIDKAIGNADPRTNPEAIPSMYENLTNLAIKTGNDNVIKEFITKKPLLSTSVKDKLKKAPINPIIKARMKIDEFKKMEGVFIKDDLPNIGYENRIGHIEIDKKLRKQGLGTKIVNAYKDWFKARDKTKIEIIAKPGSEGFWVKQGFEKYGESSELVENENGDMVKPDKMRFWLKERPIKQESIDIDETVQEDAANLSRAIENFSSQPKAFQYFDAAYKKIKDKYGIDVSDFVPSMQKALKAVENKEQRTAIKNLLSEWAVSIDPAIATKMRNNNDSLRIVELMGFTGKKKKRMEAQISDLNVIDNIVNTLDKQGSEDSHDISREGLSISNVSDVEEISNNMTFDAYDFVGDRFFKFLESTSVGGFLEPKKTAELMEEVAINDYDEFLKYLNKKYKYKPETILDNNMVKNFWVRNQPINRQDASDRPAFWWANMTKDGVKLDNKDDKRFIPKIGGHPKYGKDIRNNQDLPSTVNVSFFDYDNKSYDWNFGKLKYSRIYLNDIVEVIKGQEKDSYYSKQAFIDLSGSMVRNWDAKLSQFAKKDGFARTIISVKSGGNSPSFIIVKASKDIMDVSSDEQAVIDYLDYEIEIGNINKQMKKEMLDSMKNELKNSKLNDYVEAQHILSHEVMKRLRGRDYLMRSPYAAHHSRRLAIDDGDGIVAPGTGDFTIKIIDQSKTFVSKGLPGSRAATKKIPMSSYIGGLENKYHGDGSLWVESEYLDKTASIIGREPTSENSSKLREIKTRIRFISKNDDFGNKHYNAVEGQIEAGLEGTHYLAMKHNEFVPEEDIYITDENDNIIVYTSNVNGHIRIFDGNEDRVTMFGTLDEAKEPDGGSGDFKLDGRIATNILTLPEESRRIVKIPKQQGHNSAAFPWSWLSHLHNSKFDNLRNALTDRMLSVAKMNMDTLFSTRNNPQVMRALMGQMKSDGLSIMNEVDRLIEPMSGQMISDGFMHPHIITGMIEPVKNRMLKENSYGGRRRGFGSYPAIKSDLSRTIVKKEDGVVVSADDVTITRFLKDLLNVSGYGDELIENINKALRSRKEYLMVGRWPVYSPSAVFLARIEKVIPSGHGAVAWFHPESIVGKMQADHDGDNSFLLAPYFGKNYKDRSIIREMSSESTKQAFEDMDSFVRLEYFARPDTEYKLTKKADMYIVSGKLGKGINSQGVLMNSVGFLEDMYFKGFKAEIGNQIIVAKDPDKETEILDYAKLKENITQEMLDSAKMGTMVDIDGNTWESGDKYLKTTPVKQLHILLQAAVDNAKEFLLADWGYNGYNFIIPKMFVQENGSPIGSKQINTMTSLIRKELMHNLARRGVSNDNNRSQKMEDMFETSREMWEMNNMSGVERGQRIKEKANIRRLRYGATSALTKSTLEINNVTFNNKLTPLEKLLAVPYQSLVDYESNNPNDKVHEHPLGYHPNRIVRGIMQTQKDLYTIQKETERWYPETKEFEKDKQVARQFINEMTREFYSIMMSANVYQQVNKSKITSSGYPYQEKLVQFVDKWLNKGDKKVKKMTWNKLSEQQQSYATLRFLRGILKFSPQFQKKVGEREVRLVNKIMNLREKMANEPDLGIAERLQDDIEKFEKILTDIHTPSSYTSLSRSRDIEKILPMPLMHPGVWTEFINRFGPNLRQASNEKINLKSEGSRYEERNTKTIEQLLKDCP